MISMSSVWDRTTAFLSDHRGMLMPIALPAIFVPAVITGNLTDLQPRATPALSAGLNLASLLLSLVGFWGQLAITALALDPARGLGATGEATRRFPAALLVMVVVLAAALGAILPVGLILGFGGVDLSTVRAGAMPQLPPGVSGAVALYLLLLLPILLWIAARIVVVLPAIVGERRALDAIPRSWRLTRGMALRIVGVIILYAVVSIVANLAATTAFGAVMYLVAGGSGDGLSLASVLTTVIGGAVSTAFTVLGTAFIAELFVALLQHHESARAR